MTAHEMTEPQAFRWIQRAAMDNRTSMRAVAELVLTGETRVARQRRWCCSGQRVRHFCRSVGAHGKLSVLLRQPVAKRASSGFTLITEPLPAVSNGAVR